MLWINVHTVLNNCSPNLCWFIAQRQHSARRNYISFLIRRPVRRRPKSSSSSLHWLVNYVSYSSLLSSWVSVCVHKSRKAPVAAPYSSSSSRARPLSSPPPPPRGAAEIYWAPEMLAARRPLICMQHASTDTSILGQSGHQITHHFGDKCAKSCALSQSRKRKFSLTPKAEGVIFIILYFD